MHEYAALASPTSSTCSVEVPCLDSKLLGGCAATSLVCGGLAVVSTYVASYVAVSPNRSVARKALRLSRLASVVAELDAPDVDAGAEVEGVLCGVLLHAANPIANTMMTSVTEPELLHVIGRDRRSVAAGPRDVALLFDWSVPPWEATGRKNTRCHLDGWESWAAGP